MSRFFWVAWVGVELLVELNRIDKEKIANKHIVVARILLVILCIKLAIALSYIYEFNYT